MSLRLTIRCNNPVEVGNHISRKEFENNMLNKADKSDKKPVDEPQVNIEKDENGLTIAKLENSSPFNVNRFMPTGRKLVDMKLGTPKILSTYLTDKNKYYIGMSGYKHNSIKKDWTGKKTLATYIYTPGNMILPNCVGYSRGRIYELLRGKCLPGQANGVGMYKVTPFNGSGLGPPMSVDDEKNPLHLTKLYLDKTGKYGIKDGIWGTGNANKDPVLPGCILSWAKKGGGPGHTAFVEAIFNYGKKTEYIVASEFWYANYSPGYGRVYIIKKHGPNGLYAYSGNYKDKPNIGYSPLCSFNGVSPVLYLDYKTPSKDQQEAYNAVTQAITNGNMPLAIGDKVKIQGYGNEKTNGDGGKINCLLGIGYVTKIGDSGLAYPYLVSSKVSGGKIIGYFTRSGLVRQTSY